MIALFPCVQEILYVKSILESMELKVKFPMRVNVDNNDTVGLVNGWSINGNTKHCAVRVTFLRELKEKGITTVRWISTKQNKSDIFTKSVDGPTFTKTVSKFSTNKIY